MDQDEIHLAFSGDRNFSIASELGVRYSTLNAMLNREDLHLRISVRLGSYSINNTDIDLSYEIYTAGILLPYSVQMCGIQFMLCI